jgi:hypothetical protein
MVSSLSISRYKAEHVSSGIPHSFIFLKRVYQVKPSPLTAPETNTHDIILGEAGYEWHSTEYAVSIL